jgi:two-component system phosphate regulon sensor histidine kinase PhoR
MNKLLFTVLVVLLALAVAYYFAKMLGQPLQNIFRNIKKIADKEYKLSLSTLPVFNETLRDLHAIAERLERNRQKISKHSEGFYTLLSSIQESIWIMNSKGVLTIANESFEKLVENYNLKNTYFWNIIRQKALYDFVDSIFQNPQTTSKEITLGHKYFICSASHSAQSKETIFLMYDITEIRQLEIMKKDLVLNVSHELRTPLTSIKGFLETIETDAANQKYIEVIKRNTDRLIRIVQDLLNLSRLEHMRDLEIEKIKIEEFIYNLEKIFELTLKENNNELVVDRPAELIFVEADPFKLEQVFINLLDNAIKYTKDGRIKIRFSQQEAQILIEIEDNGKGIAPEHLPRLFERFYVVDKSRARKFSSTGLGLSIVKHIINLHAGNIEVKSELGEGTKFSITLPKHYER